MSERLTPARFNWIALVVEAITHIRELETCEQAVHTLSPSRIVRIGRRVEIYRKWQLLAEILVELDHIRSRRQ